MKQHILMVLAVLLLQAPLARPQVIKLGSLAPEASPYHIALQEIAHSWKELSAGKVTLRTYPGGIVGDEADMLRKMRIGQLNACAVTTMSLISIIPDIEALSFPTIVRSDEEMDLVIEKVGPYIEQQLEEKGFTLLTWTLAGWVHFFAHDPVITPEDLQRQKLFFWGSDTAYIELLKRTGFQPVSLPVGELLPSLQSGLVEAFASPPTIALAFQWYPRAAHMTAMRWQPLPGCVIVDNRTWHRIPENLRHELMASSRRIGAGLLKKSREFEKEAIEVIKKHGVIVHEVPDEARREWISLVEREGYPMFAGPRFSREIFDRIQAVLSEFRAQAPPGTSP